MLLSYNTIEKLLLLLSRKLVSQLTSTFKGWGLQEFMFMSTHDVLIVHSLIKRVETQKSAV